MAIHQSFLLVGTGGKGHSDLMFVRFKIGFDLGQKGANLVDSHHQLNRLARAVDQVMRASSCAAEKIRILLSEILNFFRRQVRGGDTNELVPEQVRPFILDDAQEIWIIKPVMVLDIDEVSVGVIQNCIKQIGPSCWRFNVEMPDPASSSRRSARATGLGVDRPLTDSKPMMVSTR